MTEETITDNGAEDLALQAAALEDLKERATKLGIKFHPMIGEDKLREKVAEAMTRLDGENTPASEESDEVAAISAYVAPKETKAQQAYRLKSEASELIRVRVTNMNPNKREWEGEIFTAANSVVGTFRKFVPFNVPWHVPRIVLEQLRQRQFQHFTTEVDQRGNKVRRGRLIAEFAIEELSPLSEKELKELAQRQAMAAGTSAA
jgi:hypothetical protein